MADDRVWDAIVVGAGVIGCWTALHLAKRGQQVLLLDQFHLPHQRGSSHGHSRIYRRLYDKDEYAIMMPEAERQWEELQRESGETIMKQTGIMSIGHKEQPEMKVMEATLKKNNFPHQKLSAKQLKERLPMFNFPDDHHALWDPNAGILIPDKCQRILITMVKKYGGHIRDGEKVEQVRPGSIVTVITNRGHYRGKQLVLAPGAWANDVLKTVGLSLPIKTMPGWPAYWPVKPGCEDFKLENGCPIIYYRFNLENGYRFICLWPEYEYPGMIKVASRGEPAPTYLHPDRRDLDNKEWILDLMKKYITTHVKGVEPTPCISESCMYTMTPDKGYILDRHPDHSNIIIAAGFSGHGYKAAPVLGQLSCEMMRGERLTFDISQFRLTRFNHHTKSML